MVRPGRDGVRALRWLMLVVVSLWLVEAGVVKEKVDTHVNGVGGKTGLDWLDYAHCTKLEKGTSGVLPCDRHPSCCQPDSPRVKGTDLCCPPGSHQFYFPSHVHVTCACAVPPS